MKITIEYYGGPYGGTSEERECRRAPFAIGAAEEARRQGKRLGVYRPKNKETYRNAQDGDVVRYGWKENPDGR